MAADFVQTKTISYVVAGGDDDDDVLTDLKSQVG